MDEEYEYKSICLFLESGKTFTFLDIELLCDNESVVEFNYVAMSDGTVKVGTFLKSRIVGYSLTEN